MQLTELTQRAQAGEVRELNLLSIEGGFYVLEVLTQEGRTQLTGRDGHFYRLGSAAQARRLLADLPVLPCFLIQHSAYDEMVGMAPRTSEPLKIPLNYRNAS
ncbi:DUF6482 family protein [Pseudomonas sp. EpS/L25]|uniref:DUF6482 family protein n=1 Tax=Pseudomonas sp. EpS/L25 TaxID=1749078 RepID=UPI000743CAD4|nr:DUF6482 family protein [Pseudomonas sp. EpS/L25]KUM40088.1 toxin-antitoxin system, toxin component [Pseudomonas sp. EpS/L25]